MDLVVYKNTRYGQFISCPCGFLCRTQNVGAAANGARFCLQVEATIRYYPINSPLLDTHLTYYFLGWRKEPGCWLVGFVAVYFYIISKIKYILKVNIVSILI